MSLYYRLKCFETPAVEHDPLRRAYISLSFPISVDYVKKSTSPHSKQLEEDIIQEAAVGCVTPLYDVSSLALSVKHCTKSGKTGENVCKITKDHIRQLSVCYYCLEKTKSDKLIILTPAILTVKYAIH